jgi:DNA polymerase-1
MTKLLMFDGLAILRPHYEVKDDLPEGARINATLRSALLAFQRDLATHQPTHALAAFDAGGPTWRHDLYPSYKMNRPPMPPELRAAIPEFLSMLADAGLASVRVPGVEAEDVIATIADKLMGKDPHAEIIVSGRDKDLLPLMATGVQIWAHKDRAFRTREWVRGKYGVPVELIEDYLALMGDTTDDVPGVSGVGAKTAAKLLLEHGGIIAVLDAASTMRSSAGRNLCQERELAEISLRLVMLKRDVNVGVSLNSLAYQNRN